MPIIAVEIPETYLSITRPVVTHLIRDLINRFNLPHDTKVKFSGNADTFANDGSLLASKNNDPLFQYEGKVNVELNEEYLEEYALNTNVKRNKNVEIFTDRSLDIHLYPVYTRVRNTITFTYTSSSKRELTRFRDRLRRKTSEGMEALLHEIDYEYSPPSTLYRLFEEFHDKRESVAGYGDDFTKWLKEHFDQRLALLMTMDGKRALPIINEKQYFVQGWFNFEVNPEKEQKVNNAGLWEMSFDYTVEYDKVTSLVLDYPIVIHNQLIDTRFIPNLDPYYNPNEKKVRANYAGYMTLNKLTDTLSGELPYAGVISPSFDDWSPNRASLYKNFIPIFTGLVGVEDGDLFKLLDLRNLGEYELADEVLDFIKQHREDVTLHRANVFNVELFKNDMAQDNSTVFIDEDLVVRSTVELEYRDVHHVRISLLKDLRLLTKKGNDSLRNNPLVCLTVVDLLDNLLTVNLPGSINYTPVTNNQTGYGDNDTGDKLVNNIEVIGGKLVKKNSLEQVMRRINTGLNSSLIGHGKAMNLVMSTGIIAKTAT